MNETRRRQSASKEAASICFALVFALFWPFLPVLVLNQSHSLMEIPAQRELGDRSALHHPPLKLPSLLTM